MRFSAASFGAVLTTHLPRRATGLVVALSGGMDSGCLLAAAAEWRSEKDSLPVRAIHIDHGLQSAAAAFRRACTALCERFQVPLRIIAVPVDTAAGVSLEEAAREARYAALAAALEPGECLVTAHHGEDQAETFLLQSLRGAGLKGLSSMPVCRPFGAGWHLRPLLEATRRDLCRYAEALALGKVEDPMNQDLRFDRVYLRRRLWPLIESRWPGAVKALVRTAEHAAEAQAVLDGVADADLAILCDRDALSVSRLRGLDSGRRSNAVRRWIARAHALPPPTARLHEALRQMLDAGDGQLPSIVWGAHALRRYRDRIHLTAAEPARLAAEYAWDHGSGTVLDLGPGLGRLRRVPTPGGLNAAELPATLRVRGRAGGETIKPAPRAATQSVQHLCQARAVLPWMRGALPFVFAGAELIAVGDLWFDARRRVGPGDPGVVFQWEDAPVVF